MQLELMPKKATVDLELYGGSPGGKRTCVLAGTTELFSNSLQLRRIRSAQKGAWLSRGGCRGNRN